MVKITWSNQAIEDIHRIKAYTFSPRLFAIKQKTQTTAHLKELKTIFFGY